MVKPVCTTATGVWLTHAAYSMANYKGCLDVFLVYLSVFYKQFHAFGYIGFAQALVSP